MNRFIKLDEVRIAANQIVSMCLKEIPHAKHDECMGAIKVLTTCGVEYTKKYYRDFSISLLMQEREMRNEYRKILDTVERVLEG